MQTSYFIIYTITVRILEYSSQRTAGAKENMKGYNCKLACFAWAKISSECVLIHKAIF